MPTHEQPAHPRSSRHHVAQPPSAVPSEQTFDLKAKPTASNYRRNLPHIQAAEKPIYVTFCTKDRWELPESVRSKVLEHCLHDHGVKYWLHAVIVMPDHVHLILSPYRDSQGCVFGLAEITNGIKGASAHTINMVLGRRGTVWQDESFDRVLRTSESLTSKTDYILANPVRKGLVASSQQWPWVWTEWMGTKSTAEGGCATSDPPTGALDEDHKH